MNAELFISVQLNSLWCLRHWFASILWKEMNLEPIFSFHTRLNIWMEDSFISTVSSFTMHCSRQLLQYTEFYVLLTVHPCIILVNKPNWCTILFNISIYFSSLHVSGIHVPIIRRKLLYRYDTGICHSVWVATWPADQTPPIPSDKCHCRIDTVIFSWWWAHGCPKHAKKGNKYIKQNCAPSWTYLQHDTGMHGQQNIRFFRAICVCDQISWKQNFLIFSKNRMAKY